MRRLALTATALSLAAAAMLAGATTSRADANAPVCAQIYGKGEGTECNYYTYEQCRAFVSGNAASCIDNPYYRASSNQVLPRKRARR